MIRVLIPISFVAVGALVFLFPGAKPSEAIAMHPNAAAGVNMLHAEWPFKPALKIKPGLMINEAAIGFKVRKVAEDNEELPRKPRFMRRTDIQINEVSDGLSGAMMKIAPDKFDTFGTNWDPAIAVGHKYLLVISDHRIAFYGRDGKLLPSKNGEPTDMSADTFFAAFNETKRPDGSPNTTNINANLGFPPNTLTVDPTKSPSSQKGAIDEFYDSRCFYDRASKRFIFLSAARNKLWFNDENSNPGGKYDACVRRFFAIGVSKTEDPRDGFNQWITTESNYADWPRFSVGNGSLIVAHNSPQSGKPFAYVFNWADFLSNKAHPANFEYFAADFPNCAKMLPVTVYGDSGGMSYLVGVTKPTWNPIMVFGFGQPSSYSSKANLKSATVTIGTPMDFLIDNPKFRNNALYLCSNLQVVPDRYHVRIMRIPTSYSSGSIHTSTSQNSGFLDYFFGKNGPGDAPTDLVSYLRPALSVNKDGDMGIVYGRVGVSTAKKLYPECRYSLFMHNATKTVPSVVIHTGDFSPSMTISDRLDLVNATVDPIDDTTLWFCHAYARKSINNYQMIVAKVKP